MRHASVPNSVESRAEDDTALRDELERLAVVEPSDADFLSCYVNPQAGRSAALAWFDERIAALREALCNRQGAVMRLDLEQAAEMTRGALAALWDDEGTPPGVAIFARGLAGGQYLSVVRLREPVRPSLSFYAVPDLTQTVSAQRCATPFTLILARRGGLQVLDVEGSEVVSRAWAALRPTARGSVQTAAQSRERFRVLRRALAGANETPLVAAGDGNCLDDLTAALPARALGRLSDVLRVPATLDQESAVRFVQQRLAQRSDLQHQQAASRLLRAVRTGGLGVAGAIASYEALRADAVETLVIDPQHDFPDLRQCTDCGRLQAAAKTAAHCSQCGGRRASEWAAAVELVRLALQRHIPVVATQSEDVRYLGGVGCLLREPFEVEVMPQPAVERPALDLVA
jgi:hypothetical protein